MKRFFLFSALLLSTCSIFAQTTPKAIQSIASVDYMLSNSLQGRDFWVAIPPNESDTYGKTIALEIYVTSYKNCEVNLFGPNNKNITRHVNAGLITVFTSSDVSWTSEVRESEQITAKGIHLISSELFSVTVLNERQNTSEGYAAIPTSELGTNYYHLSNYDYKSVGGGGSFPTPYGGGFIVVATEDNTAVSIDLDGTNDGTGKTIGGRTLGAHISVTLKKFETYMLRGDGKTTGAFDLSGTHITSSRPVGLISFHMRTMIPSTSQNGQDHLAEMLPPVSSWGKKFITAELERGTNRGDYFRIVAASNNTHFTCNWYDKLSGQPIGTTSNALLKAGDVWTYYEGNIGTPPAKSIRGIAYWTADKPVLLMQYSYSTGWDNANMDPFMFVVPPLEQYLKTAVFSTPARPEITSIYLTLYMLGNFSDTNSTLLKTIEFDGEPLWKNQSKMLTNNVLGTNYYFLSFKIQSGTHTIHSATPVGGISYGIGQNHFGWPAIMAVNKIDQPDTIPPQLQKTGDCGAFTVVATDNSTADSVQQFDQGIGGIELLEDRSTNMRTIIPANFQPNSNVGSVSFKIQAIDRTQDGLAVFLVRDRAGNYVIDSVSYKANAPEFSAKSFNIGLTQVGKSKPLSVALTNTTKSIFSIAGIKFKNNITFKVKSPTTFPFQLKPDSTQMVSVEYTPTIEGNENDTLFVLWCSADAPLGAPLAVVQGQGAQPHISTADFDFSSATVGSVNCNNTGIILKNPGMVDLTVTNITGIQAPFTLKNITPALPFIIPAQGQVALKYLCFEPTQEGDAKVTLTVVCNAAAGDTNTFNLHGIATPSTGVQDNNSLQLQNFLAESVPNPVTNTADVSFGIAMTGEADVSLYSVVGQKILTLMHGTREAGIYQTQLKTDNLSAGIYMMRFTTGSFSQSRTVFVIK